MSSLSDSHSSTNTGSVLGKRRADEDNTFENPPAKRDSSHTHDSTSTSSSGSATATGDVTCIMTIPTSDKNGLSFDAQSVLVGIDGSNQKAIEIETGCRLVFKDKDGEDSVPSEGAAAGSCTQVVLHGISEEVVMKGEEVLLRIFADREAILEIKRNQMRATVNSSNNSNNTNTNGSESAPNTSSSSSESAETATPKHVEAFHIPSSSVGSVIGRGGETIRDIQSKSGAHVKIQPQNEVQVGSTNRLVTISGTPATVAEARRLVNEYVSTAQSNQSSTGSHAGSFHSSGGGGGGVFAPRGSHGSSSGGGGGGGGGSSGGPSATVQVPDDRVGSIIGRGGQTIKMLQDRTGARIQVPKEGANGFRPVQISAPSSDQIQHAYREIQLLLSQEPGKPSVGSFGGPGGGGGGGGGAPWGRSDRGVGSAVGGGGPDQTLNIPVQSDRAGAIIGKAGQTIKLIQERSGCKVTCPGTKDGVPSDGPRNVIIVGPASGVEIARNDIHLILSSPPGTPISTIFGTSLGGGGGGGRPFGASGGGGYPPSMHHGGSSYPGPSNPYGPSSAFGAGVSASPYSSGAYSSAFGQMHSQSQLFPGGGGGGGGPPSHSGGHGSGGGDMASWAAYAAAMQVYNSRQPLDRTH